MGDRGEPRRQSRERGQRDRGIGSARHRRERSEAFRADAERRLRAHAGVRIAQALAEPGRGAAARRIREPADRGDAHGGVGVGERAEQRRAGLGVGDCRERGDRGSPHLDVDVARREGKRLDLAVRGEDRRELRRHRGTAAGRPREELPPEAGQACHLEVAERVAEVAEIEAPGAELVDDRLQVGAAHPEVRPEVEQGRGGAERAKQADALACATRHREERRAGDGHSRVHDDPFEEGAHPPAEPARQRVVHQVPHRLAECVVEHLAVEPRRDRRTQREIEGQPAERGQREHRMEEVGARDAEAADQPGRDPELDGQLGAVRHEQEDAEERGECSRLGETRDEGRRVEVLAREESEHHHEGREHEPAARRRAARVAERRAEARDGRLVGLLVSERAPAADVAALGAQQDRGGEEPGRPEGDQRGGRREARRADGEGAAERAAEAAPRHVEREETLARERVEVVARERPVVVEEDRLRHEEPGQERERSERGAALRRDRPRGQGEAAAEQHRAEERVVAHTAHDRRVGERDGDGRAGRDDERGGQLGASAPGQEDRLGADEADGLGEGDERHQREEEAEARRLRRA